MPYNIFWVYHGLPTWLFYIIDWAPTITGYGDGSIPINTIFRGMNIHKSQLFWGSLGTRVLTHPHMVGITISPQMWPTCRPGRPGAPHAGSTGRPPGFDRGTGLAAAGARTWRVKSLRNLRWFGRVTIVNLDMNMYESWWTLEFWTGELEFHSKIELLNLVWRMVKLEIHGEFETDSNYLR